MPNDTSNDAILASSVTTTTNITIQPPTTAHTVPPTPASDAPRVLVIGAGSRGYAYSQAILDSGIARIVCVAEPRDTVRASFGRKYVWGPAGRSNAEAGESFAGWEEWVAYAEANDGGGVDVAFVCVLDDLHLPVVKALSAFGVHIMCEKPLSVDLDGCLGIYGAMMPTGRKERGAVFGIGHVLRYAPHNVLLRKLVREQGVIGEIMSVEHTEPVGWWHYGHSYVRGNWRKESTSAPFLLTKSCHDLDWLFWMLCSPPPGSNEPPHLPSTLTSTGSLRYFRKVRKPRSAGAATNCLSCPIERDCKYSAKRLYIDTVLGSGDTDWPVDIVVPDIEDIVTTQGMQAGIDRVMKVLEEDYGPTGSRLTPDEVKSRSWYGRCVWESDNDVCDDQSVTIAWDDDPLPVTAGGTSFACNEDETGALRGRGSKTAIFHMVAFTDAVCARRGRIYGTDGEVYSDSTDIYITDFKSGSTKKYHVPAPPSSGHGGGDDALAINMLKAVIAVRKGEMGVREAEWAHLGCDLDEVVRSHAAVFAAEEARKEGKVVQWAEWWDREVNGRLKQLGLGGLS